MALLSVTLPRALSRSHAVLVVAPEGALPAAWEELDPQAARRRMFDLADPAVLRRVRGLAPGEALGRAPVLVREAHRAPELLEALERTRGPAGQILLLGSVETARAGSRAASEGLTTVRCMPEPPDGTLRIEELLGVDGPGLVASLARRLEGAPVALAAARRGFLPPSVFARGAASWVARVLVEATSHVVRTADPLRVDRLAEALLARSGLPLALAAAAREVPLPLETARRHAQALAAAGLHELLDPHPSSEVRSPVLLPADSMLAASPGIPPGRTLRVWATLALARRAPPELRLAHWATHAGARVDLVAERGGEAVAVVLRDRLPQDARGLRGVRSFLATRGRSRASAIVLTLEGDEVRSLGPGIVAAPLGAVGAPRATAATRERARARVEIEPRPPSLPDVLL